MIERSILVLFEPDAETLLAQVQFVGNPHGAPPHFLVYRARLGDLWFDWCRDVEAPSSPIIPLVCLERRRLVTSNAGQILVMDLDASVRTPEPAAQFPFPLEEATHWVSCSQDGVLHWCGQADAGLNACATDLTGALLFVVPDSETGKIAGRPCAPPLIGKDRHWILSTASLVCFREGRVVWQLEAKETIFGLATALADNSVLLAAANRLIRVDESGQTMFDIVFEEELNTPPIVDSTGRIYVASKEMLYAFD
jgi:hypothetical protein